MTLSSKVVKFVGLDLLDDADEIGGVREIPIVHSKPNVPFMRILIEMIHPARVERGGPALDPVNFVTLSEQELGQISSILTGDACDQRLFQWMPPFGFKVIENVIDSETQG
jgi:hypothetical protein